VGWLKTAVVAACCLSCNTTFLSSIKIRYAIAYSQKKKDNNLTEKSTLDSLTPIDMRRVKKIDVPFELDSSIPHIGLGLI
jgi:hypothetical protein